MCSAPWLNQVGLRLIVAGLVSVLWQASGSPMAELIFWLIVLDALRVGVLRWRTADPGSSPAPGSTPARPSGNGGFAVILESPGSHRPAVAQALAELLDMAPVEAHTVLDRSAVRVCSGTSYVQATQVAAGLERAGARVSVVVSTPEPDPATGRS